MSFSRPIYYWTAQISLNMGGGEEGGLQYHQDLLTYCTMLKSSVDLKWLFWSGATIILKRSCCLDITHRSLILAQVVYFYNSPFEALLNCRPAWSRKVSLPLSHILISLNIFLSNLSSTDLIEALASEAPWRVVRASPVKARQHLFCCRPLTASAVTLHFGLFGNLQASIYFPTPFSKWSRCRQAPPQHNHWRFGVYSSFSLAHCILFYRN